MRPLKIYFETTMFNYYFDADRDGHPDTVRMFEEVGAGKYAGYTSQYAVAELQAAPSPKREQMLALIEKYHLTVLDITPEVERLIALYIQNQVVPSKSTVDASHIAIASVNELDCILSFNFRHINRLKTKQLADTLNIREGYKTISFSTPTGVMDNEDEKT